MKKCEEIIEQKILGEIDVDSYELKKMQQGL